MNRALLACILTTTVILASLAHLSLADPKPPPISLKVRPSLGFEPLDVRLEVRVHPIDSDRFIRIETDGPDFSRRSEWTIEGADSPVLYSFVWPACLAGTYAVYARIGDGRHWRASVHEPLTVLGR